MKDQEETKIPREWKMTTIGYASIKIGDGNYSSKYPRANELLKSGIPFISNKDLSDGRIDSSGLRYLSKEKHTELQKGHLKSNDVLVSTRANIGDIALVTEKFDNANINAQLVFLRVDEKQIHSKFLYFLLSSSVYRNIFASYSSGSAQSQLPIHALKQIPLVLPGIIEQRAIAAVLSSLDDKIELLREQNKTLEATAQAIFKEWFVNFNFPGTTGKMIDSESGKIPEGWRIGILNDYIGELESGKRPKGGVGQLKYGVPSVGAESINGISGFDFSKTKYISEDFFQKMNLGKVKDYDILVYKDGGTPGTFLPRFTISGEGFPFSRFSINEHVFRVQPKKIIQRFFLYIWLNSFICKHELQNIGGKAAIPGINSTDFKNIPLLLPSSNILAAFHCVTAPNFKKILFNNSQIQTIAILRDALLPKLMKGELRVK